MNIIFLDIDGVLNSEFRHKNEHDIIEPYLVELLNKLHSTIDKVYYVIVSAWRCKGREYVEKKLTLSGFTGTLHENWCTSDAPANIIKQRRGHEVSSWIYNNSFVGNYVILDDSKDYYDDQPHIWVQPSGVTTLDIWLANEFLYNTVHDTKLDYIRSNNERIVTRANYNNEKITMLTKPLIM